MPKAIRQENLYGAEDWSVIYSSFKNAEFTSYDFDTLRDSMVNYMQINYAEEFNDYIQNSEFIALLDLVAYVGQNLAFRMDLNARENILDTAEKRESVLRIARMLSYKPKRVRPAVGFMKVVSVSTSEQILDSTGSSISNKTVQWGSDPSDLEYERFIRIMDSAFNNNNRFGTPVKRVVNTDSANIYEVYEFNNLLGYTNYPVNATVDGASMNFDLVPIDIDSDGLITQLEPDYNNSFSVMYRNDGKGVGSSKTGFFFMARQGYISSFVEQILNPISNVIIDIPATSNVSEEDFFVQTVDQDGAVIKSWDRVGNLDFNNIVLNEYGGANKDVYEVIYSGNDVTSIKFGDGTFTNTPAGNIRVWYRTAENRFIRVKAGDITGITIDIPYTNTDNQQNTLSLTLELQDNMVSGLPAETIDEIKINAPEAFYSKNRMVTADDYNGFLPTLNSDVLVMKAENRTFSGHSRYVDLKDPTGKSRPLVEFADDGYLYKEESAKNLYVADNPTRRTVDLLDEYIESQLSDLGLLNFYYGKINLTGLTGEQALRNFDCIELGKTIYYTRLKTAITSSQVVTVIEVNSINTNDPYDNFDVNGGLLEINNERFTYTGLLISGSSYKFIGITRAVDGTVAQNHSVNAQVWKLPDFRWRNVYNDLNTSNGYISESNASTVPQKLGYTTAGYLRQIRPGSLVKFRNADGVNTWVTVKDIKGDGLGIEDGDYNYTGRLANGRGTVELSKSIVTTDTIRTIIPPFPRTFDELTRDIILGKLEAEENFALRYDNINAKWTVISTDVYIDAPFEFPFDEAAWLLVAIKDNNGWTITTRQLNYIFGSEELLRFYNINFAPSFNPSFKSISYDKINVLGLAANRKLETRMTYTITGYYVYDDGYTDNSKVRVTPLDLDNDFLPDDPLHFINIVANDYVKLIEYNEGEFSYMIPQTSTSSEDLPGTMNLAFKWEHNVPIDQTLNPSLTNVIDVYVLNKSYNDDYVAWKRRNDAAFNQPLPPTSEELRTAFTGLTSYKMMTDEVIFHPVKFKPLFGKLADLEFQAQFKVVKNPRSRLTDSEIKSKVVAAIDKFFTPGNFGFGEIFYFTELAAYVHTALKADLSSVVIVPISTDGRFGTLFQIQPDRNEVVTSVANVNDIIVINEITDTNIRIGR